MQPTEIKAVNESGFSFKALLTVALLCLAGPSLAAEEKAVTGQPVLSVPAANTGQGAEAGAAVNDEASVSINQADAEQLASILKGVGLKKAESIVRYREQNGPFTQIEQLQEVPGIGPALFEKNRARLKM
ncbi:ComEA family DNA-binding protein [Serratia quinivorans]|uniref:ComEA family DNA-binding protein n=1 Tax=Serratia quinivorans TaxID=137545 RepID=UPI002178E36B|nr:ComEA family DNA-binding protein [Serratia quinivorans]CAI0940293.1 competence protein ComEA helix-hairpin-helix repeat region [Serratia quinivorans]CAI1073644.1 competence protein ComEA helix-hairpin-helix repeat region [Serratia quinivorans]CAI1123120.1 competence protein ComEA helix-hairpin-helix repeat region [Serratia quinivorans]CAI1576152.1 competence protein ComEA helix-hairpin-helix repeat region [Serratia quinivorans]CAI2075124.1 competence protein ComEA helix-hairpin-helix repeat